MSENKRKKNSAGLIAATVLLCLLCVAAGGIAAYFFMPSFKVDTYYKYVERGAPDELALVWGDEPVPDTYFAVSFGEDCLLDMDFLVDYGIDPYLFWDEAESIMTVSTPLKIIRMKPDEAFYTENGEKMLFPIENTALYVEAGKVFIPLSFIERHYPIEASVAETAVIVDSLLKERSTALAARNASVRYEPDIKSDIAEKLKKGDSVYIFDTAREGFYRVRTAGGAFGFLREQDVTNLAVLGAEQYAGDAAPAAMPGQWITLVWDQVAGEGNGEWLSENTPSVNVVSPTWFSLTTLDGGVGDAGSVSYAESVKSAGYRLWPLVSNSFDADLTHGVLISTSSRQRFIENLAELLKKYGADGVNVDFESYRIEDGYYYTQLLRELCVYMRLLGIVTSVDLPVPTLQNSPTDRAEIGRYADFVAVMAYDQHWANSSVKGPVAAKDWVYQGIERTLEFIPAEKVLLGLPLYTRIWYQPVGTETVTTRDFGMRRAQELFELRNAAMVFEENTGYNKGEYEYDIDGIRNVITSWLETIETVAGKAEIAAELELAGVACWKKGLEDEAVWERLAVIGKQN